MLYGTEDADGSSEITETGIIQPWEQTFVPKALDDLVLASWDDKTTSAGGPPVGTNLWGEDGSGGVKKPTVAQCPYHKHECRKGVCQWRAKQVREEERLQKLAEKTDKGGRGGVGKGRGPGGGAHARTSLGGGDGFSTVTRGGRGNGRKGKDNRAGWDDDGASVKSGGSKAVSERGGWGNASEGPWRT